VIRDASRSTVRVVPVLVYIDGNELRAAEIRQILPEVELRVDALSTGFSTSAPEPGQRARDKVLAHPVNLPCCAEAVDLVTVEGKSLRLELDSENETRFCKWWRETPVRLELVVAMRRAPGAEIELLTGACAGQIASKPAGPHVLGWDRLFIPDGDDRTLAQLAAAGEIARFRRAVYAAVGGALGAAPPAP